MERNEIDIKEIIKLLIEKKRNIFIITFTVTLLAIVYALIQPNVYTSKAILAPTNSEDSISSQLGGLSGFSGIAGISFPGAEATPAQEALERMQSFNFFSNHFLPNINLEDLMAVEGWLPEENILIYDEEIFISDKKKWIRDVSFPRKPKPSDQESYEKFLDYLKIVEDRTTTFVELSITHKSPYISKEWLDVVIAKINSSSRDIDIKVASDAIDFLTDYYQSTNVNSLQDVSSRLLENQMQKLMLASATDDYVFKVLEYPIVSEEPSGPDRIQTVLLGFILGLILSFSIVVYRNIKTLINLSSHKKNL